MNQPHHNAQSATSLSHAEYIPRDRQPGLCCQTAIRLVATMFHLPQSALRGRSRGQAPIAFARQIAMYISHVVCRLTLTEIAREFDRDRTTVAHACRCVEDRRDCLEIDRVVSMLEWSMTRWVRQANGN